LAKIRGNNIILTMKKYIKRFRLSASMRILLAYLGIILLGAFLLSLAFSNANWQWLGFMDGVFTSTSAVCVTGLSVGITPILTTFSKLIIALLMFVGRIGLVTFVMAITSRSNNQTVQEIEFTNTYIVVVWKWS